jgi:hypothetical protein
MQENILYSIGFSDGFKGFAPKKEWLDHDYIIGYNAGVLERELDIQKHKELVERNKHAERS